MNMHIKEGERALGNYDKHKDVPQAIHDAVANAYDKNRTLDSHKPSLDTENKYLPKVTFDKGDAKHDSNHSLDSRFPDQDGRAHAKYAGLSPKEIQDYRLLDQGKGGKAGPEGKGWDDSISQANRDKPEHKGTLHDDIQAANNSETALKQKWTALHDQVRAGQPVDEAKLKELDKANSDFVGAIGKAYPDYAGTAKGKAELDRLTEVYTKRARAMLKVPDATADDM